MTGRLNFLETPWGPIEPWDDCLPTELRKQKNTYSHMVTDHYHYFHSGGEAYHTLFDTWEFERGQEGDFWHPLVKEPQPPVFKGKNRRPYWVNREFYDLEKEEDYPTPKCFQRAIDFLNNNHEEDNWHLHLEVFDPHEPFVCPQKYKDLYGDTWDGPFHFDWPSYQEVSEDEKAVEHIQKLYAGVLTMTDVWLGKLLDTMDELNLWEDTALIVTTDHGYLLGEHNYWAKNYMFDYEEIVHIPLIMCTPKTAFSGRRVSALTAAMDIMPTILSLHGAAIPQSVHGQSLLPLLEKEITLHDAVLYGYFGKDVNLFDGTYTYCRQPLQNSITYHHTLMPRGFSNFLNEEQLQQAEYGCFLQHCHNIAHLRIPQLSHRHKNAPNYNPIYNLKTDFKQEHPIFDDALELTLAKKMKELLMRYEAPQCQFTRLGLY